MKTLYSIILLVLFSLLGFSQVPESFSYQAIIRNASGDILASSQVAVQISILEDSESGSAVYVETFNPTTTQYGLMAVKLGKGSVQSGSFSAIDWGTHAYYVKVEVDPNNGTDYTHMGTSQLLAVPYALYAKSAANVFSGDYNDLTNAPTAVSAFTNDAGYLTSYTETDPVFGAHPANGIAAGDITNWNTAFGWGDHSAEGYLTSFTETDPVFGAHPAHGITSGDISEWNTAFGWGDHAAEGYITDGNTNWDNTYGFITAGGTLTGFIRSTAIGNHWINGGDVGIGTSSPDARLHVNDGYVIFDVWPGNTSRAEISTIGGGYAQFYLNDGSDNTIGLRSNGFSFMRGGRLEIGSGTRNYASAVGDLYVSNILEVDGWTYSVGYTTTSDKRWKRDVVPVENALSKVLQLNGVNFYWKTDEYPDEGFTDEKQIGFIAQEVEQILPELVRTDRFNNKGVSYDKITAVLVEAIKEQQQMIEELKQEVEKLKTERLVVTTQ